jgi:oxygen-independent coproporphyrinogen-3 oxidase
VLNQAEIQLILDRLRKYFEFDKGMEFTLEANPDDLNSDYLLALKKVGVNRLSVGIQSFFDRELQLMNRSHDAAQARKAFSLMKKTGFDDYSVDLIFGMPGSTLTSWKNNLEEALSFEAPHFSFYNLTVEPKTALEHMVKTDKVVPLEEQEMAEQFLYTMEYLGNAGYEHYEISNYALPGRYAKHNTAYWQGVPYLGLGPSAHSFCGNSRQWNVSSNSKYIKLIDKGEVPFEREILQPKDQFNEYVMTGLRTMWGVSVYKIEEFGQPFLKHFEKQVVREISAGRIERLGDRFYLTRQGKLFADEIARELFFEI